MEGPQGIGKTSFTDFIRYYVLGENQYLETGSEPLKSRFNINLGGKLLVIFEELENTSVAEWSSIISKLKRQITSDTIMLEAKNQDPFQALNINNYIVNSNDDAIKDA